MVGRSRLTEWFLAVSVVVSLAVSVAGGLRGDTGTAVGFAGLAVFAAWGLWVRLSAERLVRSADKSRMRASGIRIFLGMDIVTLGGGAWSTVTAIQSSGGRQAFYAIVAAGLFICGAVLIYYTVLAFTRPVIDPDVNSSGPSDDTAEPQN